MLATKLYLPTKWVHIEVHQYVGDNDFVFVTVLFKLFSYSRCRDCVSVMIMTTVMLNCSVQPQRQIPKANVCFLSAEQKSKCIALSK